MSKELSETEQNLIDSFRKVGVLCRLVDTMNEASDGFSFEGVVMATNSLLEVIGDIKKGITAHLKEAHPDTFSRIKSEMAEKGIDIEK